MASRHRRKLKLLCSDLIKYERLHRRTAKQVRTPAIVLKWSPKELNRKIDEEELENWHEENEELGEEMIELPRQVDNSERTKTANGKMKCSTGKRMNCSKSKSTDRQRHAVTGNMLEKSNTANGWKKSRN